MASNNDKEHLLLSQVLFLRKKKFKNSLGLQKKINYNKIFKDFKKEFCYNGTIVQDPKLG
jgi:hypothetical protein